jgi:hypothetical protein
VSSAFFIQKRYERERSAWRGQVCSLTCKHARRQQQDKRVISLSLRVLGEHSAGRAKDNRAGPGRDDKSLRVGDALEVLDRVAFGATNVVVPDGPANHAKDACGVSARRMLCDRQT